MRGSHGWAEIDAARKQELIDAIESGGATRGPAHVELDLTDRCNVACYFCNQQDVRTTQQISLEHVRALIDELASTGLKSVRFSGGGDPLAHREFAAVLDHVAARGVVVDNLTTNAALLGPEIAARLVSGPVGAAREVLVSLNAATEADYARMMQVKPVVFERVLANVRGLLDARGGRAAPAVSVQFLIDRRNYTDLPRMYELGRSLRADRIPVSLVLNIPLARIDPQVLLHPDDGEKLRPFFREILAMDLDERRLQMHFPVPAWNAMLDEMKRELAYPEEPPLFPTSKSFRERDGHCFFGWYTATIRGNGDLYPCCLLMSPGYEPLGNALEGRFSDHWNGPAFTRLRGEMREVLLDGDRAEYDSARHRHIQPQCVTHGACWLKNMYFRGGDEFYARLSAALDRARRRNRLRLAARRQWKRALRAARSFAAGPGPALP